MQMRDTSGGRGGAMVCGWIGGTLILLVWGAFPAVGLGDDAKRNTVGEAEGFLGFGRNNCSGLKGLLIIRLAKITPLKVGYPEAGYKDTAKPSVVAA